MYRKHNKALTGYARQLRQGMTQEERKLWYEFLRGYPVRFLRQKVIGQYIVDFYCAQAGLVLEVDGGQLYPVSLAILMGPTRRFQSGNESGLVSNAERAAVKLDLVFVDELDFVQG